MKTILFTLLLISSMFGGDTLNLSIPQASQSYASDRFRSGDMDCSQAIGSASNVEFGVMGILDDGESSDTGDITMNNSNTKNIGVYGRIIIPLDGPKQRINCNTLYQLELRKKRLEVQKLEAEVKRLKSMQFEIDVKNVMEGKK